MKYKIISITVALILAVSVLTSCGAEQAAADQKGDFEIKLTQSDPSDTVSDENEKLTLEISSSLAPPDLHRTLAWSELIISGEVIEKKEPYHTNPDGTLINSDGMKVFYAMATPYLVRVDEVYRGNANPGDVIVINTMNDIDLPLNARDDYIVETDIPNIYLDVGQKAVFCLGYYESYYPNGTMVDDVGYSIADRYDGIFDAEPHSPEQAAAANAEDQPGKLMHSANFTINLDTFADEIEEAIKNAAKYGVDENGKWIGYPNSAI